MKICFILVFGLFCHDSFCQKVFAHYMLPGVVIEQQIDAHAWRKYRQPIPIHNPLDIDLRKVDFVVVDGIRYKPVEVSTVSNIQGSPGSEFIFPEILVSGTISLYRATSGDHVLLEKDDRVLELFEFNQERGGKAAILMHVLVDLFKDCDALSIWNPESFLANVSMLQRRVIAYNESCGKLEYALRLKKLTIGPAAGYRYALYNVGGDLKIRNQFLLNVSESGMLGLHQPYGGLFLTLGSSRKVRHFGLGAGIHYSRLEGNGSRTHLLSMSSFNTRTYTSSLQIDHLSVEVKPRFFFAGQTAVVFAGIGVRSSIRLHTEGQTVIRIGNQPGMTFESTVPLDDSEYSHFTNAFLLEAGIRQGRFTLECEYAKGMNEYFNAPVEHVSGFSLRAGYTLFTTNTQKYP